MNRTACRKSPEVSVIVAHPHVISLANYGIALPDLREDLLWIDGMKLERLQLFAQNQKIPFIQQLAPERFLPSASGRSLDLNLEPLLNIFVIKTQTI